MHIDLRTGFISYLIGIHLVFAVVAFWLLRADTMWLPVVELFVLLSFIAAFLLFRRFYRPLRLILGGADFLRESDFSTRLLPTGEREMDKLIGVYNAMIDSLREERLKLQEQHYLLHKIVEASPSGIILFDFEGRCVLANPASMRLLETDASPVGKTRAELFHSPAGAVGALLPGGSVVVTLPSHRRVQCRLSEFIDRGFTRTFLVMEELTEEVRRVEKIAYEKVIRTFSHEVNNSVGAANSLLQSCLYYRDQLRQDDREDFETAIRVAVERGLHLCDFVQRYAEVFKLPAPHLQPCDVVALLDRIALLLSVECRERNIEWRRRMDVTLPPVAMDRAQMEQAFLNICRNAVEAIGVGGVITVRTGRKDTRLFVAIEDTGCGIPAGVLDQLFTPFFTTKQHGQGIGLTMTQEILLRHGFDYAVESTPGERALNTGEGSRGQGAGLEPIPQPGSLPRQVSGHRVLAARRPCRQLTRSDAAPGLSQGRRPGFS